MQLICPLLRCVGNLLSCCPVETLSSHLGDDRIMVALVALLQAYLQTQPALARECAWVLNNLTGLCSPQDTTVLLSIFKHICAFFKIQFHVKLGTVFIFADHQYGTNLIIGMCIWEHVKVHLLSFHGVSVF